MFGMGLTLKLDDFAEVARHPWRVALGVVAHFVINGSKHFIRHARHADFAIVFERQAHAEHHHAQQRHDVAFEADKPAGLKGYIVPLLGVVMFGMGLTPSTTAAISTTCCCPICCFATA